jgi:predicted O-linked N-acetylglucosamine transferase (SPINDLY family)
MRFGEAAAPVPTQARHHDIPFLSATALRLALPTLLLARHAFDLNRCDTVACVRTAECLLEHHRPTDVLDCLDLLDASVERGAAWHLVRAHALSALRDDRQAVRDAMAAVAKAGLDADLHQRALLQLGQNLTRLQEHAEAGWCYRTALAAQPQAADAALATALGSAASLDWDTIPSHIDRLLACMAQQPLSAAHQLLAVPLDPSQLMPLLDHPLLQRWLAALACQQRHGGGATREKPKAPDRRQGRWRLGILAGGRHQRGSALVPPIAALFDAFDRTQVELYIYSDTWADHPRAVADTHWHDSRHASTDDLVGVIRGDRIDLLLDLTGPGEDSRLGVLAQRPAPVQATWLGHAGTTGAPWVDYLIGDPVVTPLEAQAQFSECIAQLPGCHRPVELPPSDPPPAPLRRTDCGLPDAVPVIASFNPPERITAAQFHAWCQILSAVPGAVLWLLAPAADAQRRLRAHLAHADLDHARLVFAPKVQPQAHLARLPLADLVLDCFPGNAAIAARDALWAGVPVLTRIGQGFAARRTASLLAALRLPALVCADAEHYVRTAVHLLHDTHAMAQLRARLTAARTDTDHSARDLEHLLTRMVARHDAGLPPTPLAAEPAPRRD